MNSYGPSPNNDSTCNGHKINKYVFVIMTLLRIRWCAWKDPDDNLQVSNNEYMKSIN